MEDQKIIEIKGLKTTSSENWMFKENTTKSIKYTLEPMFKPFLWNLHGFDVHTGILHSPRI